MLKQISYLQGFVQNAYFLNNNNNSNINDNNTNTTNNIITIMLIKEICVAS